ncbi:Olfactory Receptor 9A4 [Manis pentadactyla]|nr:Olfactory Receptor 9A4 [Manis pentadactyla]
MLGNYSSATEFYLLGFPGSKELHRILFATFFFFYLVTLVGNMVIIMIVCVDKRLQSPMYFFLSHLSALEILVTTIIVPGMLWGLLLPGMQTIPLTACVAQLFLYLAVGTTEFALLGAMAVDRYVAVCHPLRYNIIMSSRTCNFVVIEIYKNGDLDTDQEAFFPGGMVMCSEDKADPGNKPNPAEQSKMLSSVETDLTTIQLKGLHKTSPVSWRRLASSPPKLWARTSPSRQVDEAIIG